MQTSNAILGVTVSIFSSVTAAVGLSQVSPAAVALGCLSSVKFGLAAHHNSRVHEVYETW